MTISQRHTKVVAQIFSLSLLPNSQFKWCFKPMRQPLPANHLRIIYYSIFTYRTFALGISSDSVALQFISVWGKVHSRDLTLPAVPLHFFSYLVADLPMILLTILASFTNFYTVVWQFGLSKDSFSINSHVNGCRLSEKWKYSSLGERKKKTIEVKFPAMIKLLLRREA